MKRRILMRCALNETVTRPLALWLLCGTLTAGAVSAGCGGRPDVYDEPLEVAGPIVVGRHLAYMDKSRERITLVRPYTREVDQVEVGRRPSFMLPSPDDAKLLVVCKGWIAKEKGEKDEDPSLHVIDPVTGESEVHTLESPFDEVAVSDDNRHAVAFFSANSGPGDDEVFRNPNAVAILDLQTGDLVHKTVRSFGDVPRGVIFSPHTMAPVRSDGTLGEPRTLAAVFATGYITLLDVTNPERSEVTIRLTLPEMTQEIVGQEMVFVDEAGTAYLRASNTNDIYAFTLTARQPEDEVQNDFQVSINTLAAGSSPGDIAVFTDEGEQKVLVANRQSENVTLIDAHTSQFVTVTVGDPVDRILLYPEEEPHTAVLYSQAGRRSAVHFLDLRNLEENKGRNLSTLNAAEPVLSVDPIPARDAALVVHTDDRAVLSVLDLETRTLNPLTAHNTLSSFAFTASGGLLAGFTAGSDQIGLVDMSDLSVRTLQLLYRPAKVIGMRLPEGEEPGYEMNTLVVTHGGPFGRVTVIPNPRQADTENVYVMSGFLMEGFLDDRF
jgi:hypothetical protein